MMWQNMKIGTKIALGFGILIVITFALGAIAVVNMTKVARKSTELAREYVPEVEVAVMIRGASNRVMYAMRGYGLTENEAFYNEALKEIASMDAGILKGRQLAEQAVHLKQLTFQLDNIEKNKTDYQEAMDETRKRIQALASQRKALDENAAIYMQSSNEFLKGQNEAFQKDLRSLQQRIDQDQQKVFMQDMSERHEKITLANDVIDLGNDTRVKTFKTQAARDKAYLIDAQKNFAVIDQKFNALRKITRLDEDLGRIDRVENAAQGYSRAMTAFLENWESLEKLGQTRDSLGKSMIAACIVLADAGMEQNVAIADEAMHSLNRSSTIMSVGLVIAIVVGLGLAFIITRGITRSISRVVEGLSESAEQVASASGQVSSASQSLAEGASEQAASIEETSSSLEEMSAMTRQNADNANQADALMKQANQVVAMANQSMGDLTQSMEDISKASEETSKIIKTIDEIAFQTNLLALNAAVEAARAGEAGAGFAVVADEVRNLAMRAADAAKNTANLIESTVKKVKEGGELVCKTNDNFTEVAKNSSKVGELVGEIAAASREQAQGISQVNAAVNEMDKVTQQNAANAEESASASEEMNAQAEQMKAFVADLEKLVNNRRDAFDGAERYASASSAKRTYGRDAVPAPGRTGARSGANGERRRPAAEKYAQTTPAEQIIPLDDDFRDF